MIDEWCGGRRQGPPHPAHPRAAVGPGRWPPTEVRRCAAKGSYAIAFTENPSKLGLPSLYTGEWDVLWSTLRGDRHDGVDAHRLVVVHAHDLAATRRSPPRCRSTRRTPRARCATGSSRGTLERFPDLKIAYAESQVGWMPFQLERMDAVWPDGARRRRLPGAAQRAGPGPGLRLRVRRPASASRPATTSGLEPDPVRDRLPALRRHVPALAGRSPTACSRPPAWTPTSATPLLRGNAIEAYGLERFGITE